MANYLHPDFVEIVVVRHGETTWNSLKKCQGQLDIELNELGKQQAAEVADRLSKEPKISAVYSSDLKRALETAQTIASKCGGLEVVKDLDLRERHMGNLQGLVFSELEKTNPIGYNILITENQNQEIPGGGESLDQLFERCKSSLLRIGRKHKGQRVVVVSHGASIQVLYKWACPDSKFVKNIYNASVTIFHLYSDDKLTLKLRADISHLTQN
ncbi:phosphoglycerate mutase-like protein 4 isoform X1 [Trifolium pratense]|uniref:phosphoglycerate mutase-like protein 4 isoform X1 n=1 Tax=Trifolium pratense TaxID=57577 RepID=UPI001E694716|nr:phosphoglycerate mutase-like protein 4 isoform X1 [Trifolium pratense]XP_045786279.1 phosphoglycerate mutase-like protein 4 isoform X1 [Trifolium pratense]